MLKLFLRKIAMKLCKRMLEADMDLRISASEALRHDVRMFKSDVPVRDSLTPR